MKRVLLVAIVAFAVLLLWRFAPSGRRTVVPDGNHAPIPARAAEAPMVHVLEEPPQALERLAVEPSVEPATGPGLANSAPSAPSPEAAFVLSGTITVIDEQGLEHAKEDGTFSLSAIDAASRGISSDVTVLAGRWSLALRDGVVEVAVFRLELGERPAMLEGRGNIELEGRTSLDLRARWLSPIVLHVQDRESRRELPDVQLVKPESAISVRLDHPGLVTPDPVQTADSPLVLAPASGFLIYHARSPGYAWGRILITDPRGAEDRFLLLDRAGALSVTLAGAERDRDAVLRLRRRGMGDRSPTPKLWPLIFETHLGQRDVVDVDSLPIGSYRASVEAGWQDPRVLAEALVDVVADLRAEVLLTVARLEPEALVPLEGTLELPPEWGFHEFVLAIEGLDHRSYVNHLQMELLDATVGLYRWSSEDVRPGYFKFGLLELPWSVWRDVGTQGERSARIVVPPPCEVSVRCVDEKGLDVDVDRLLWTAKGPEDARGIRPQNASRLENRACWSFRAPEGEIELRVDDPRFQPALMSPRVEAGKNDFVLRLEPSTGLVLVFRDGSTEVPWDFRWKTELLDAAGTSCGGRMVEGRLQALAKDSGIHRLRIGEIPGYELVPEETIELERGKVLEHVVELRRR